MTNVTEDIILVGLKVVVVVVVTEIVVVLVLVVVKETFVDVGNKLKHSQLEPTRKVILLWNGIESELNTYRF